MDGLVSSGKWRNARSVAARAAVAGVVLRIIEIWEMAQRAIRRRKGSGRGCRIEKIEIWARAQRAIRHRKGAGATREHLSVQNIEGAT